MAKKGKGAGSSPRQRRGKYPIKHWSHSSLLSFLANPLAWYKRYVEQIYDTPRNPASVVGSAGHKALENFYSGIDKETSIARGLAYIRDIPDFELNFGKAKSRAAKRALRAGLERDYLQAIDFYLAKPPKHHVLGVEVRATVKVQGLALPIKAVSDLVVESKVEKGAVDVVDHKFVAAFSKNKGAKSLFVLQALFNYFTVRELYGKPVRRFIVYECKKSRNKDGSPQMKRYVINYADCAEDFKVFKRLINDASAELSRKRIYLPNPSDMFEGENSFDVYRLSLAADDTADSSSE
jgi:hypothetical protein